MNRFDVGSCLWVSRFSPHIFTKFNYDEQIGEWYCSPEKIDIFQRPTRYVVTSAYAENENSKKWILELAIAASDEHCEPVEEFNVVAATLSGAAEPEQTIRIELNLNKVQGGVFKTYDDLIVTKKRSKNFQTLTRKLTGLLKQFKTERKYRDMALVSHCLTEIKSDAQVVAMIDKHPEYFL